MKLIRLLKRLIPLIGFLILFYLILEIGLDKILDSFLKLSPIAIILSAILTFPRLIVRNIAWQMICKKHKLRINFWDSLKFLLIGYLYAVVTPSYVGHLVRIPYIKEVTKEPSGKIFTNILIEVILRSFSLYILMLAGAALLFRKQPEILYVVSIYVAIALSIYWFFSNPKRGKIALKILAKIFPKKRRDFAIYVIETFYKDFPEIKSLILPLILGGVTWLIAILQLYIIALSLDIEIPFHIFLVIYPLANAAGFIPISSGGIGTREAVVVFLLSFFNISPERSLVLSLCGFFITDVLTGMYGFVISILEGYKIVRF